MRYLSGLLALLIACAAPTFDEESDTHGATPSTGPKADDGTAAEMPMWCRVERYHTGFAAWNEEAQRYDGNQYGLDLSIQEVAAQLTANERPLQSYEANRDAKGGAEVIVTARYPEESEARREVLSGSGLSRGTQMGTILDPFVDFSPDLDLMRRLRLPQFGGCQNDFDEHGRLIRSRCPRDEHNSWDLDTRYSYDDSNRVSASYHSVDFLGSVTIVRRLYSYEEDEVRNAVRHTGGFRELSILRVQLNQDGRLVSYVNPVDDGEQRGPRRILYGSRGEPLLFQRGFRFWIFSYDCDDSPAPDAAPSNASNPTESEH